MMNPILKKTAFLLAVIAIPSWGMAQDEEGGGFDQTQVITGDRSLTVQKAMKISALPEPFPIQVEMGTLTYQMVPKRPETTIEIDSIKPAKVKVREPLDKLYKGFVKAGIGLFATPYVEGVYTSLRKRDLSYGVHLRHLSSHDGINRPVAFSGYNENMLEAWVKKIYKEHSIQGKLNYQRNGVHYYGFDPQDMKIDKKDIRQTFNLFDMSADWKSYYRDSSRINHDIDLDIYHLSDNYDASEFGVKASANLRSIRGEHFFTLNASLDILNTQFDDLQPFEFMDDTTGIFLPSDKNTTGILELAPQILLAKDNFRALVGLSIYGQFGDDTKFNAFPNLEFSYSLFNDMFIPYAGMQGSVNRNSYRSITDANPFVLSSMVLKNEKIGYDIFGGFRGTVSDHLSFNTRISTKQTSNTPLFVNDTLVSAENRFTVVYDNVKTFTLLGEVTYQKSSKWSAGLRAEIFSYDAKEEDEAWQLPSHRIGLNGTYSLFDKIVIGGELAWVGKRQVKSLRPVSDIAAQPEGFYKVELDGYIDLSLSVEYRYTTRLSVFVEANNLTASKYDIYYRFPAQRLFVMGGAKYAF